MTPFPPPKLQYKLAVVDLQERQLTRIAIWRSCCMIGCVLSLGLLTNLSLWEIKHPFQIEINGKKLVDSATIHHALDFSYPQSIWTVNGANLTQKVESIPAIKVARIDKQIIPPKITIALQERTPVALATSQGKTGFLDLHGTWVSQEFYTNIDRHFTLPKLVVINYQARYQSSWKTIYQLISLYPELEVNEVYWNYSGSLFLQTRIGRVFLGTNLSRLEEQFKIMLKLQNLPEHIDRQKIAYIDLSNPNINLIQRY